jgi:hypothetical protein
VQFLLRWKLGQIWEGLSVRWTTLRSPGWRLCNRCQKKRSAEAFSIVGHTSNGGKFGSDQTWGVPMLKILTATAASLGMLGAAAAADLPRKEPPPPAPPVGKAPIGKYPVGKAPIGKYPQPVVTKG